MDQATLSRYVGFAHDKIDKDGIDNFQTEMKFKMEKHFNTATQKEGVVYQAEWEWFIHQILNLKT